MQDLKETSTTELIQQIKYLESEIDNSILAYNQIIKELYYRSSTLDNQNETKPKILIKNKIDI